MVKTMSKKPNIVSPELCGLIPDGQFNDSSLIYYRVVFQDDDVDAGAWTLALREQLTDLIHSDASQNRKGLTANLQILPAPTLEEILQALVDLGCQNVTCAHHDRTDCWDVYYEEEPADEYCLTGAEIGTSDSKTPLIAALKLWLEVYKNMISSV